MDQQRSAAAGGGRTSRRTRLRVPVVVASALAMLAAPTTASAQALEDPFGGGDYTFATTDFGGEDPFAPLSTTGGSSFEAGAGFTTAPVEPFTFGAADAEELLDLSGPIEFGTTPAGTADLFAPGSSSTPSLSLPWDGGAAAGAAPTVQTDALRAEMQRWQRDLQAEGVIAHSAAEVFNNHQQELSSRFGLSAQQATEALGGSYSNRVGQRLVGPATVGPAIVGEGLVGEGIVGQGIVGEGLVGPCLDASCPNWGEIAGFGATAPAAGGQPGGTLPGGTLPEAVTRTPGGSTTTPAPSGTQPAPVPLPVPGIDAIPSAPPAQSPQEGGGEGTAAAPNPFRAPIYAATGAGFSYLLNRGIQPDLGQVPESTIAARLAPNIARGAVQDYVFAGGLPPINTGDPWTSAIANGCQGAAATQCMLFGSRRVLNPGVDSIIANQRANAGADALIDPRTVTLSPNASLNIPQGRTPDSPWTNPSALDAAEFLPASGTTPEINPNTFADPGVRFDPVFGLPRLGTPPGATDPAVEYSIADMQAFTPEQRQFTQRVTDGTILGINLAAPLLSTATDQTLRALGQEDNYALNVARRRCSGRGLRSACRSRWRRAVLCAARSCTRRSSR